MGTSGDQGATQRPEEPRSGARVREVPGGLGEPEWSLEELLQDEPRFRATFEQAAVGMAHVSLDGRFLRVNDRLCEITGYPRAELVGRAFPEITHPEDLPEDLGRAESLGRGEIDRYRMEKRYLRKDGSAVWVELHGSLLRDEVGAPVCFVAVIHEIGERKRMAAELREHWRRISLAERVARFGTWERSLTGPGGWWSPECYRIFGVAEGSFEPSYENFLRLVHPDDRAGLQAAVEACVEAGGRLRREYRIVRPDGAERTLHSASVVLRGRDGRAEKLLGAIHDVTALRRSEEDVRESERRLRTLADAMPQLVWTARPDGGVDYCNIRLEEYADISRSPEGIWNWAPLIHPEDLERTERAWCAAVQGSEVYQVQHRVRRRDGAYGWHLTRAVPWLDDRGRVVRWFGTTTDIGTLKAAEADLRRARDAAQAAAEAKSRFLSNMSHEIRTPLGGVLGMAEILAGTSLSPEQRECVEAIRLSGNVLLGIVNDVLDFSRIESAGVALDSVSFGLRQTLEDTVHLQAEAAHAKGVELCCRVGREVPALVRGDPVRLRQVVFNLVGNAVKFTERGQVVVRAALEEVAWCAAVVRVEVEDTGVGIPSAAQPFLFEAFTQADASTTRRFGGTGLGLAISRRLVEAMGGEIGFRSAEGRGSTFWFTVRVTPESGPAEAEPSVAGIQALVVVPNSVSREFLRDRLAAWGAQAAGAAGREEAVRVAGRAVEEGRPFRMAFVEMDLPDGSGLGLARELGSLEAGAAAVALLAPFTTLGLAAKAREEGGLRVLWKPVREKDLSRCVTSMLGAGCQPAAEEEEAVAPPAASTPRGRVLLAEDDPINRMVVVRFLDRLGFRTDVAEDGSAAVAAALSAAYDLILLDWQMPGMDGLAAAREIRRREGPNRGVPIVALTAHALGEHRVACLAAGMDDYLSKPVEFGDISHVLDRWTRPAEEGAPEWFAGLEARMGKLAAALPPEVFDNLADLFPREARGLLRALSGAVGRSDAAETARHAHTLRGSCSHFGTDRLLEIAAGLEARAAEGSLEGAEEALAGLSRELDRVEPYLEARKAGRGG